MVYAARLMEEFMGQAYRRFLYLISLGIVSFEISWGLDFETPPVSEPPSESDEYPDIPNFPFKDRLPSSDTFDFSQKETNSDHKTLEDLYGDENSPLDKYKDIKRKEKYFGIICRESVPVGLGGGVGCATYFGSKAILVALATTNPVTAPAILFGVLTGGLTYVGCRGWGSDYFYNLPKYFCSPPQLPESERDYKALIKQDLSGKITPISPDGPHLIINEGYGSETD